jgi:hypothetical protein
MKILHSYGKPPGFLKVNHPIDGPFSVVMVVYWRVILVPRE